MQTQQQEIQKTRDKRAGRAQRKKILSTPLHLQRDVQTNPSQFQLAAYTASQDLTGEDTD